MRTPEVTAAVLAGGLARRLGGTKATILLDGRPLIERPLAALAGAGLETVVIAKPGTPLPALEVPVWLEPDQPTHPAFGLVTALERAGGAVLAVACDMPFVTPPLLSHLAALDAPAVVPEAGGRLHPLLARYEPATLPALRAALERGASLGDTVAALEPRTIGERELGRFGDPEHLLFNVNSRADLARAEAILSGR